MIDEMFKLGRATDFQFDIEEIKIQRDEQVIYERKVFLGILSRRGIIGAAFAGIPIARGYFIGVGLTFSKTKRMKLDVCKMIRELTDQAEPQFLGRFARSLDLFFPGCSMWNN